jgi:hypothetical protein
MFARTVFASMFIFACSSSSSGADGLACIETSGPQTICLTWSNTPRSQVEGFCQTSPNSLGPTSTLVSSCPTDHVFGTCTVKQPSSTMTQVLYDYAGETCTDASEWCAGTANGGFQVPNAEYPWSFECNGD